MKAKEAAVAKFRTQQLEVKKNDEYRAMTQQIEQTEAEISTLEESEIELMLEIDTVAEQFEADKAEIEVRIQEQGRHIDLLVQKEQNLNASIDDAKAALAAAREGVDASYGAV